MTPIRVMYDSTNLAAIPRDAKAVMAYVDGEFRNFPQACEMFPHARKVSIATQPGTLAEFIDCEKGDFNPDQAVADLERAIRAKIYRPGMYGSRSTWTILTPMIAHIPRHQYRKGLADPTGKLHPVDDFDFVQSIWLPNYDVSWLAKDFFPGEDAHPRRVHPKVLGAGAAGALGVLITAFLHSHGLSHLTPAEGAAISTLLGSAAGWTIPSR